MTRYRTFTALALALGVLTGCTAPPTTPGGPGTTPPPRATPAATTATTPPPATASPGAVVPTAAPSVVVSNPDGSTVIGVTQVSEADFKVPFYPGARVINGGKTTMNSPDGKSLQVASAQLETTDSVDKVVEFYTAKFEGAQKMDINTDGRRTVTFAQQGAAPGVPAANTSGVVVRQEGNKTMIVLTYCNAQ